MSYTCIVSWGRDSCSSASISRGCFIWEQLICTWAGVLILRKTPGRRIICRMGGFSFHFLCLYATLWVYDRHDLSLFTYVQELSPAWRPFECNSTFAHCLAADILGFFTSLILALKSTYISQSVSNFPPSPTWLSLPSHSMIAPRSFRPTSVDFKKNLARRGPNAFFICKQTLLVFFLLVQSCQRIPSLYSFLNEFTTLFPPFSALDTNQHQGVHYLHYTRVFMNPSRPQRYGAFLSNRT